MRSNKGFCEGWKEKWNGFRGEMYQVIKLLLYIFLNSICSLEWEKALLWSKTSMQVAIFLPSGKIPWYTSSHLPHCNFLENEKLFQQQVKRNFGSFTLMMSCPHVVIERCVPLNWNSKVYKHIAFRWVQTRLKCSPEQLHFLLMHAAYLELTTT